MFPAPVPTLPTFDYVGFTPPPSDQVDALKLGESWLASFSKHVAERSISGMLALFLDDGWWRDLFALTWDVRTFHGVERLREFLLDRLEISNLEIGDIIEAQWQPLFPDIAWIQLSFAFTTEVGLGTATARLVLTKEGCKATIICTALEGLKGHPELIGALRESEPDHGRWAEKRRREVTCADRNPEVLIVGGGQAGLSVAARLKALGVSHLIVEKNARIGDNWRSRYDTLCLHEPIWYDHLPYMPYPSTFPMYLHAHKLADWLEGYATAMDLNSWTSTEVTRVRRDETLSKWAVTVRRLGGSERTLRVDHVVFATAFPWKEVHFAGEENFQGELLHSTSYHSAKRFIGKKVVIVGACTSAHDIASDCANLGIDVTMYQRSSTYVMSQTVSVPTILKQLYWEGGPPTEYADRVTFENSMPVLLTKCFSQRLCAFLAEQDKALLEGLTQVGYKLDSGPDGAGFAFHALNTAGGYYVDVGACQKIIDGKIQVKNGSSISRITEHSVHFADGSKLEADVIILATGFDDARGPLRQLLGDELGRNIPPIWGLDSEGEPRTVWREIGLPNAWCALGNLSGCRFWSRYLALQIKAKQEKLYGTRYAAGT